MSGLGGQAVGGVGVLILGFAVPGPAEPVPFVHLPLILATPPRTSSSPLTWTPKQALPSPTPLGWGHSGGVGTHKT